MAVRIMGFRVPVRHLGQFVMLSATILYAPVVGMDASDAATFARSSASVFISNLSLNGSPLGGIAQLVETNIQNSGTDQGQYRIEALSDVSQDSIIELSLAEDAFITLDFDVLARIALDSQVDDPSQERATAAATAFLELVNLDTQESLAQFGLFGELVTPGDELPREGFAGGFAQAEVLSDEAVLGGDRESLAQTIAGRYHWTFSAAGLKSGLGAGLGTANQGGPLRVGLNRSVQAQIILVSGDEATQVPEPALLVLVLGSGGVLIGLRKVE